MEATELIKPFYKEASINGKINTKDVNTENRTITGYGSVFDFKDSDNDIIRKNAFTKSIVENGPKGKNRIKLLWQHDLKQVCGFITELEEDGYGLKFSAVIEDTSFGNDILERIKNGSISEVSIGFQYIFDKCNWIQEDGEDVFEVHEVKLWELSLVSLAANEKAKIQGVKSYTEAKENLEKQYKDILKLVEKEDEKLKINQFFYKLKSLYEEQPNIKNSLLENHKAAKQKDEEALKTEFYKRILNKK